LLGRSGPAGSPAELASREELDSSVSSGAEAPASTARQVAPAAGPAAPDLQQAALAEAVAPTSWSGAPELCPRSLVINRHLPTPFTCACSGEAARSSDGAVWGTDVYTDDSDLCRAALHAGVIGADGGPITVARSEGRALYIGSSRNGVASNDYGSYDASIAFAGAASPPLGPEPCPGSLVINRNLPTPFTCTCSGEAARSSNGAVWGTDVYTDDSDLCRAALHAGAIGADGGQITVARSEGRSYYIGSARNGVASNDYGSYDASIAFQ
jgi:LCCL domain